ncbi:MAG: hydantoinase B/oxoprolinase family protein [Candidatus Bathyarchaeota archaeon]|nr:MAG: hydantoinase B/oxoprolinase family protein [Candidatus Bathyarchaeota archaeon]
MSLDATTIEVIKGALIYAAEEMGVALRKSAYSPNIKERMDHSCALFDHQQRLVAQAEHIPVHLGSMALAVREGLRLYEGTLGAGDMLLLNDPYISGTHLPDLTLIAPVFHEGRLIGYAANKAHHTDVGGRAPGSIAGDASELYQEGLIIPPVKFVRGGEVDSEIAALIRSNVRTPDVQMGDLRAQIAANNTGIRRLRELIEEHGVETVQAAMEAVMDYSERRMRAEIAAMPDGVYEAEDWMEDTGTGDEPVKIKVRVTIDGEEIGFDYSGTAPQVDGPVNAPLGVTLAGVFYTLISITDPTIPVNDGCFRPISLHVPEGCMMNPRRPAPVAGGNVETSQRNVDTLLRALAEAVPEKVPAASQGTMNNISIGGVMEDGASWTFYETIAGGSGGRPDSDGVDGVHVHMTNTMNTPIEALEAYLPLRFESYRLRKDSGGPGRWRGGCGVERSWTLTSSKGILSILAERTRIPPWGLRGGSPGALGEYVLRRGDGSEIKLPSKCTVPLGRGDALIIRTPGGGGYGHPLNRPPGRVLEDVKDGLVSLEAAERDYGVVIDPLGLRVSLEATESLRKKLSTE